MPRSLKVAVIGAGIGGLTAAAALRRFGIDVEVFEQAPQLGEVGAGLQIGPNAVKVIKALGLEDELLQTASEPTNIVSLDWKDASLRFREPLKSISQQEYGARYLTAHRADLHRLLQGLVPESRVHLNTSLTEVRTTSSGAVANFANGHEVECDVLVGADGIHSVVRASLFGKATCEIHQSDLLAGTNPDGRCPNSSRTRRQRAFGTRRIFRLDRADRPRHLLSDPRRQVPEHLCRPGVGNVGR